MSRLGCSGWVVGLVLLSLHFGCQKKNGETPAGKAMVTILTAASLRECVDEMVLESGLNLVADFSVSTGASSSLAQQIQSGAQADLFLSANGEWAQAIVDKFPGAEKKIVAGNSLVLVAPPGIASDLRDLASLLDKTEWRIGIAGPEVPAGKYARQALKAAGVLDGLVANNRLIIGQDVRQVLRWVELGEVDAGLVYRTDTEVASAVKTLLEIDPKTHDDVEYWLVLLNGQKDSNGPARQIYEWFSSDSARQILKRRGFLAN